MLLPSWSVTKSVKPTQCGCAPSKRPNFTLLPSITFTPPLPVTELKLGCIPPCSSDCFSFMTLSISCATRLSVNCPSGNCAMMVSRMRWLSVLPSSTADGAAAAAVGADSSHSLMVTPSSSATSRASGVMMLARRTTDISCSPRAWAARISLAVISFFTCPFLLLAELSQIIHQVLHTARVMAIELKNRLLKPHPAK